MSKIGPRKGSSWVPVEYTVSPFIVSDFNYKTQLWLLPGSPSGGLKLGEVVLAGEKGWQVALRGLGLSGATIGLELASGLLVLNLLVPSDLA